MKILIIFLLFLTFKLNSLGQTPKDSIQVNRSFGTTYYQHGEQLTPKLLLNITLSNPAAYAEMKIARTNSTAANVLGGIGGFIVGFGLGPLLVGKDADWGVVGVGAGFIGISIPFSIAFNKHARNAARIYNEGLNTAKLK